MRTRGNPLLAQLAHAPILPVGHIPEFHRVVRMKVGAPERVRMEEPSGMNACEGQNKTFHSPESKGTTV